MATIIYLTTTEVARKLGLTRQAILMRVHRGTLTPTVTLDGGGYLFDPDLFRVAS